MSPPALTSTSSTVVVGEQRVEGAEPVEAGDRGAHQPLADVGADERGDPAQVAADDGVGRPRLGLGGPAQLGHEHVVGRRARPTAFTPHPAARGSSRRGRRAASSPASTARAIAGSMAHRRDDGRADGPRDVGGAQCPAGLD